MCIRDSSKGPSYLVGIANFGTSNAYHHMNIGETTIHLEMAKFTSTLTRDQRIGFASILNKVDKMYNTKEGLVTNATAKSTLMSKIPTTDAELRNLYLNGKNSIIRNLPRPNVSSVKNHSYISIRQCIAHFFSEGRMPHHIPRYPMFNQVFVTDSRAARDVFT